MFIGHYKSVNSANEFYSSVREDLDFPTQVEYKNERYLLNKTVQISGKNIIRLHATAKYYGIDFNVELNQ